MTLTEAQTRQKLIDEKLGFAGWNVNDPSQVTQELDIDLVEHSGRGRVYSWLLFGLNSDQTQQNFSMSR